MRRVRLADLLASAEELAGFSALLTRGGVAAVPTETFYGLAADPTNEGAVSRIYRKLDVRSRVELVRRTLTSDVSPL